MGTEQDLRRMAELAAAAADRLDQQENPALDALLSEMQALGTVLPGVTNTAPARTGRPAERFSGAFAIDADIEAGFDNMPV